jgi:Mn-dependent DtxR family transcriptional regulator
MKLHNKNPVILRYIKKHRVVTTSELAGFLKISWNTAEKYLLELAVEQKVVKLKKQGVNLWLLR